MQSPAPSLDLQAAIGAARSAGDLLLQALGRDRHIRHKSQNNLVTDADEAAEVATVAYLQARFPGDSVLAEEGTQGGHDPDRLWIIDPLDGTTNFAHGYPVFSVSIALEVRGTVQLGVVYQPVFKELFWATRGGGAFLNHQPVRVSSTDRLEASLLSTGFSYDRREIEEELDLFGRFVRKAQAVRRDGSAALNLCYVAMGRFDGFWERSLKAWDLAAGALVVIEAGGQLSDYAGGPCDVRGAEILASNGLIHDQLLGTIREALPNSP